MQDATKGTPAKRVTEKDSPCPKCGGRITYRGFMSVACETSSCENFDTSYRPTLPQLEFEDFGLFGCWMQGTLEWAVCKKRQGHTTYIVLLEQVEPGGAWSHVFAYIDPVANGCLYAEILKERPTTAFWDVEGFPVRAVKLRLLGGALEGS